MNAASLRSGSDFSVTTEWRRLLGFAERSGGRGGPFALATLVAREGSSYRQPGARLLIAPDGRHAGSLSGGCLEDGIAQVGCRVLRTGVGERLRIDTRPHFGCPGVLDIWVEALAPSFLADIEAVIRAREPAWVVTRPETGAGGRKGGTSLHRALPVAGETEGGALVCGLEFLPRLLIASATSDADELSDLATWMGWEVRRVVHSAEAQSGLAPSGGARAEIVLPERLGATVSADSRTACVIMTHHLGRDLAYLRHALEAGYSYVGLLGSRRRREALLGELGELGVLADPSVGERLFAPVGLDLGAHEPRGIALAIVAEIQAVWARRSGGMLRDREGRLHCVE